MILGFSPVPPIVVSVMQASKWNLLEKERGVIKVVWIQVKGLYEKPKEETNAKKEHIRKMLQEMACRYYRRQLGKLSFVSFLAFQVVI